MLPSATSDTVMLVCFVCTVLVTLLRLAVAQLVDVQRYKQEVAGSIPEVSFRPHHGPGVESAYNINEY
jgi:hypothetical protein